MSILRRARIVMRTASRDASIPHLIAGLFALLGIGALLALAVSVGGADNITRARQTGDIGRLILEFLYTFGIVTPLLLLAAGLACLNIARKLWAKDLLAAKWSTQILFWLMIFSLFGIGILIINWVLASDPESTLDVSFYPYLFVIALLLTTAFGFGWRWLRQNQDDYYVGQETLL